MGKRKKSGRTKSQAELRAAAAERRREAHARMVSRRHGDPNYTQQTRTPTGRTISWSADSQVGREISEGLRGQRQAFVEKFGREPGPDDPVFFDPDADEPVEMSAAKQEVVFESMLQAIEDAGIDPAFAEAARKLGYIVTAENQHLFSAHEVEAWDMAVHAAGGGGQDPYREPHDGDAEELAWADLLADAASGIEMTVGQTLVDGGNEEPALRLVGELLDSIDDRDEEGHIVAVVFSTVMAWLVSAREAGIDASAAVDWVDKSLSKDASQASFTLAGLLGHALAPDLTVNEVHERLGPMTIPAMIWLVAGVVATAGGGDAHWIRQFDVTR